jgi:hypothetical protein
VACAFRASRRYASGDDERPWKGLEKCGNTQFIAGERKITHDQCVRHDDAGFTMIKFVK